MEGLVELVMFLVYAFLIIIVLTATWGVVIYRKKMHWAVGALVIAISAIPLAWVAFNNYFDHRSELVRYVGVYELDDYHNCKKCILDLKADNTYTVFEEEKTREEGKWVYRGGEFPIVEIGKHGQLGDGEFQLKSHNSIQD